MCVLVPYSDHPHAQSLARYLRYNKENSRRRPLAQLHHQFEFDQATCATVGVPRFQQVLDTTDHHHVLASSPIGPGTRRAHPNTEHTQQAEFLSPPDRRKMAELVQESSVKHRIEPACLREPSH